MGLTPTQTTFTVTAGRTGTAWLSEFLSTNIGKPVVHEPIAIDDFGTNMPDIRTMRHFNTFGNDPMVQAFWRHKFERITCAPHYAETNHTLAKCGLIENLVDSSLGEQATLIVLRRDLVRQCVSHLVRHDFSNVTIAWQWYLHPDYPKRLVAPKPFLHLGQLGFAIWYCFEMLARQTFYMEKYGDRLRFVEARLEDITTQSGAQRFWEELGGQGRCSLPPPRNQTKSAVPDDLTDKIASVFTTIRFDIDDIVGEAVARGFSFDAEPGASSGPKRAISG